MEKKPTIFITGASGFIGHHLVKLALDKGYAVHTLVRRSSQADALKSLGANILYGDITDYDSIKNALSELLDLGLSVDYVIHAAALTKARSEKEFEEVNCKGTQNLLSALKYSGIEPRKFIFISSLAAPGPTLLGQMIEESQSRPITRYGKSKLQAEAIVRSLSSAPYLILRPTAVYGPGEKDLFTVFKIVSRGLNPVLGFNAQELTFIYVKDLVGMIMAGLESKEENKSYFITDGGLYHKAELGNAIAIALKKSSLTVKLPLLLVRALAFMAHYSAALVKKQSALNPEKYRELTAQSWNCNAAETFAALHYKPAYTLQEGVNETAAWYRQNKWI